LLQRGVTALGDRGSEVLLQAVRWEPAFTMTQLAPPRRWLACAL
jgi:hypothetical protein